MACPVPRKGTVKTVLLWSTEAVGLAAVDFRLDTMMASFVPTVRI